MRDPWETDEPAAEIPSVMPETKIKKGEAPTNASPDPFVSLQQHQASKPKANHPNTAQTVNRSLGLQTFNRDNLLQGIIWAEILGKPLSKRGRGSR